MIITDGSHLAAVLGFLRAALGCQVTKHTADRVHSWLHLYHTWRLDPRSRWGPRHVTSLNWSMFLTRTTLPLREGRSLGEGTKRV
ncbi:hypothetical protein FQN60_000532 [Etheostoma spectabile]|uniref:Uncharacterized protein n=1 Tax=Etheostoma spectabile TaxID=54343 RepID=A0A5J5D1R8_9PERO|nr:hypothetical protein FQN60_000532 [Etheostoma spectabile]